MVSMFNNYCTGCCGDSTCFITDKMNADEICPCGNCLLKAMCSEVCKERKKFFMLIATRNKDFPG
jgi:hypothetical protein